MSHPESPADSALPDPDAWWTPATEFRDPHVPTNDSFLPPDAGSYDRPIFSVLCELARRQPMAMALRAANRDISYAELVQCAQALGARIAEVTAPGNGVAILLADEAEVVIAQFACLASGRVAILLNASNPAERVRTILESAGARALLIGDTLAVPDMARTPAILRGLPTAAPEHGNFAPADIDLPAIVDYTSGSTGTPRGFIRTQRQVHHRLRSYINALRLGPSDRVLSLFSTTNGSGLFAGLTTVMTGGTFIPATTTGPGLRNILGLLHDGTITVLWAIPTVLRTLLALPDAQKACHALRATNSVSEAILGSDLATWRAVLPADCAIHLSYSMTEASGLAFWVLPPTLDTRSARLAAGYPNPAYDYAIVGPDGHALAAGEVGELWVRSAMVTLGEWRGGVCVPGRAIDDPDRSDRRILRTGDLARLRPDGMLELAGRADDMVKIRGNRVEPLEVEDTLRRHPAVADVAVLPLRTGIETSLIAHVVLVAGATADRASLLAHLRVSLPAHMLPARLTFHPVLPRLANGKIDARRLGRPDD